MREQAVREQKTQRVYCFGEKKSVFMLDFKESREGSCQREKGEVIPCRGHMTTTVQVTSLVCVLSKVISDL